MFIIGCGFHSRFQQIATLNPITGEILKRRLQHENGEAKEPTQSGVGKAWVGSDILRRIV